MMFRIALKIITRKQDEQDEMAKELMLFYCIIIKNWKTCNYKRYPLSRQRRNKKVYTAVMNYLQVPAGSGEGNQF